MSSKRSKQISYNLIFTALLAMIFVAISAVATGAQNSNIKTLSFDSNGSIITSITPLNSDTTYCYLINNFTISNTIMLNLKGQQLTISIEYVEPNSTQLNINDKKYNLTPGQLQTFMDTNGYVYVADLGAITYTINSQSLNVDICATLADLVTISNTTVSTTTSQNTTSINLNETKTTPPSSTNYVISGVIAVLVILLVISYLIYTRGQRKRIKKA